MISDNDYTISKKKNNYYCFPNLAFRKLKIVSSNCNEWSWHVLINITILNKMLQSSVIFIYLEINKGVSVTNKTKVV